mmetsp:Transcript_55249/g.101408  ORF Transcript_55249/g.101408 Transcript_55249/m.101408 type:complete len:215 (-) Transcript_55249:260-904(-)
MAFCSSGCSSQASPLELIGSGVPSACEISNAKLLLHCGLTASSNPGSLSLMESTLSLLRFARRPFTSSAISCPSPVALCACRGPPADARKLFRSARSSASSDWRCESPQPPSRCFNFPKAASTSLSSRAISLVWRMRASCVEPRSSSLSQTTVENSLNLSWKCTMDCSSLPASARALPASRSFLSAPCPTAGRLQSHGFPASLRSRQLAPTLLT